MVCRHAGGVDWGECLWENFIFLIPIMSTGIVEYRGVRGLSWHHVCCELEQACMAELIDQFVSKCLLLVWRWFILISFIGLLRGYVMPLCVF